MRGAALAAARLLWPGLRRILLRLGRWVIDELVCEGAKGIAAILRAGVRRLKAKLKAVNQSNRRGRVLRVRWLRGRIRRWQWAARWFEKRVDRLKKRTISWLNEKLDDAIPEQSPLEHFDRWRRLPRAA